MTQVNDQILTSIVDGGSFISASRNHQQKKNRAVAMPARSRNLCLRKRFVVGAVSEDVMKKFVYVAPEKAVKLTVRAVVVVRTKTKEDLKETLVKHMDAITEWTGKSVTLELISTETDPKTGAPKRSQEAAIKDWTKKNNVKAESVRYVVEFLVDSSFGIPGAIAVSNKYLKEFFLESITVEGFACGPVHFSCNSWVQPKKDHPGKRIFFHNKPYLPNETPAGLKVLREKELKDIRGNGKGERKLSDRIYDYDVYNDLGNPDKGLELSRTTLGGQKFPYPRRCRTGRAPSDTDMRAESRVEKPLPMYVPRDEQFGESKQNTFSAGRLRAVLHNLLPSIKASITSDDVDFTAFGDIDLLYKEGLQLKACVQDEILRKHPLTSKAFDKMMESSEGLLRYDTPMIVTKDKFAWIRDDEFGRQAIAGINPVNIERLRTFPPKSNLDPTIYGSVESAIKEEHITRHLHGMSLQEALENNKLFIIDYHDIYLPFINRINSLEGRKSYATRTIFLLTDIGTLKPIAIELSLPSNGGKPPLKKVASPPVDATTNWIWQLAKAHVCSNDAGVHQLVNHWLRTHACLEPFILSAHRNMSEMHPIYKFLDPHMRYTLEINGLARQTLISADGVIESSFTPGRYCMEISSAAYKSWRFDEEGLPADLIRRGVAVADPMAPHGLKLLLEDYPYAQDGLLIWEAIQKWVGAYVNHYYPNPEAILDDEEVQGWYRESIRVGHADHRDAEWWPGLDNADNLVSVLTTLIWLASAQHAALNFGQYPYGGYIPNRPPLMRRLIPEEGEAAYKTFLADPQKYFLLALPSLLQTTKFMAVVDTLSTHSPDEEYLGERQHASIWNGDAEIVEAFYEFSAEIRGIEKEIEDRNSNPKLRNRCGAGVLPYELLAPSSGPGITCRGVPNSVSI